MIYCFVCRDGPQAEELRKRDLDIHLAHIEKVVDRISVAGPIDNGHGGYCGSLIMIEADSEAEARQLFDADPYARAGIWESVELLPFHAVAGAWVGGTTWKKQPRN